MGTPSKTYAPELALRLIEEGEQNDGWDVIMTEGKYRPERYLGAIIPVDGRASYLCYQEGLLIGTFTNVVTAAHCLRDYNELLLTESALDDED